MICRRLLFQDQFVLVNVCLYFNKINTYCNFKCLASRFKEQLSSTQNNNSLTFFSFKKKAVQNTNFLKMFLENFEHTLQVSSSSCFPLLYGKIISLRNFSL